MTSNTAPGRQAAKHLTAPDAGRDVSQAATRHIAVPLAAVYIWVAASFEATPKQLGFLTLSRALVQALASPLGGIMGALRKLR